MSIRLRKRGQVWYARGTVRVGKDTIAVPQFSTGCALKGDAEAVAAEHEARIRRDHLAGPAGRQDSHTITEAFFAYLRRPGGVKQYDKDRIADFATRIGNSKISEAADAWETWRRMRAGKMAPATVARWRAVYVAGLVEGCKALGAGTPPMIPGVSVPLDERVVFLTDPMREKLLASYSQPAADVAVVLAYQGLRTQEALRMDWRYLDFERRTIFVANEGRHRANRTKAGRGRSVPMHPRVYDRLMALREKLARKAAGSNSGELIYPEIGAVFLSRYGKPYTDTRATGGNPLSKAHASACKKAGITDFRVHDWRHDWASRLVMAGVDLETLRKLGGWSSLRMLSRYASVSQDHMRDSIARLG